MTPDAESAGTAASAPALSDGEQALEWLRQQGAGQLNSVEFDFMNALAQRMRVQPLPVRQILQSKLALAVAAYQAKWEQAQINALEAKLTLRTEASTGLGQLIQSMALHTPEAESRSWASPSASRTELKSVHYFRNTWSKLSAQKQVSQALGQAPQNAGPINSHMRVLRSLELMRDTSIDYLNRFMCYADTLLCLDQVDLSAKVTPAKPIASGKSKARTPAKR